MKPRLNFSTLPIGTKVCCALNGNGKIVYVAHENENMKVKVAFGENYAWYRSTGQYAANLLPTLRLGHDRYKIGEPYPDFDYVDDNEIKPGDWCLVWDDGYGKRIVKASQKKGIAWLHSRGNTWDNWVKIPAGMLEKIKELTKTNDV